MTPTFNSLISQTAYLYKNLTLSVKVPDCCTARLALEGYVTGGSKRNRAYLADKIRVDPHVPQDLNEVAFDPQTSGGLLIAAPEREAEALARALLNEGVLAAAVIGEATSHGAMWVELVE